MSNAAEFDQRLINDLLCRPVLTVEEAAVLLRIGRTKAYAEARRYRDTNGAEGLPVVLNLGKTLRCPTTKIKELLGMSSEARHA